MNHRTTISVRDIVHTLDLLNTHKAGLERLLKKDPNEDTQKDFDKIVGQIMALEWMKDIIEKMEDVIQPDPKTKLSDELTTRILEENSNIKPKPDFPLCWTVGQKILTTGEIYDLAEQARIREADFRLRCGAASNQIS